MALSEFDAIVNSSGFDDYSVIQDADDDLDGGAYMLYVKAGTYAGFTVSTTNVYIFCEPGTVITGAVVLSGAGVCLQMGAGSDIQALTTLSGIGNSLICENGVDLDGVTCTGASCYVTGGGWDTISDGGTSVDGATLNAADIILENIAVQTTAGGGNSLDGVSVEDDRIILSQVKVIDSDNRAIFSVGSTDTDALIMGCVILGSDARGMHFTGARSRLIGNYLINTGNDGILFEASGDDSVAVGNVVQDQGNQSVEIDTNAENCVIVGNRLDGAVTDNSGTSTVALNDATSF